MQASAIQLRRQDRERHTAPVLVLSCESPTKALSERGDLLGEWHRFHLSRRRTTINGGFDPMTKSSVSQPANAGACTLGEINVSARKQVSNSLGNKCPLAKD